MKATVNEIRETEHLLKGCLAMLETLRTSEGDQAVALAQSIAWRLADAGALFRDACEYEDITGLGISEPTGRGASLPTLA